MIAELITPAESVRLAELEGQIESNVAMVGRALFEIRESRLYRQTHGSFDDYCQERFSMDRKYINKQIQAAEVIENLTPNGRQPSGPNLPTNERQARPLAKLPAEQQPAAWERAQEIAKEESKPVAARHVEAAVLEVMPKEEVETVVVDGTQDEEAPTRRPPLKIIESEGMRIWLLAKSHLDRINKHDEFRVQALQSCADYCTKRIESRK